MAKKPEKKEEQPSVAVSVRLPGDLVTEIDTIASDERRSRGNTIRLLLEDALKARESKQ